MKNNIIVTLLLLVVSFIAACDKEYISTSGPAIDTSKPISFKGAIVPIFTKSCLGSGCHGGDKPPTLTADKAYDQLINNGMVNPDDPIAANSVLYQRMTSTSKPMPPGPLLVGEAQIIKLWIEQGSQNN